MMNDTPNFMAQWLERIETKLDRLSERVVTRDEFERYKIHNQREHDETNLKVEKLRDNVSSREKELQTKKDEEAMKMRLFWSGLILTPIATIAINFLLMRGGV